MEHSQAPIVERFFVALDALKASGELRGRFAFAYQHGINPGNFYKLSKDYERKIFNPSWLSYLVTHYGFSADWLLTGRGTMRPKASTRQTHK